MAPPRSEHNIVWDNAAATANEKRAMLAMIAEHGTEGQLEWERNQRLAREGRSGTLDEAAARGAAQHAPRALNAEFAVNYDAATDAYSKAEAQAMLAHGREMDRIAASNSAYMDALMQATSIHGQAMDSQIAALLGQGGGGGGGYGGGYGYGGSGEGDPGAEEVEEVVIKPWGQAGEDAASLQSAVAGEDLPKNPYVQAMDMEAMALVESGASFEDFLTWLNSRVEQGMSQTTPVPYIDPETGEERLVPGGIDPSRGGAVMITDTFIERYAPAFGLDPQEVITGTYDSQGRDVSRINPETGEEWGFLPKNQRAEAYDAEFQAIQEERNRLREHNRAVSITERALQANPFLEGRIPTDLGVLQQELPTFSGDRSQADLSAAIAERRAARAKEAQVARYLAAIAAQGRAGSDLSVAEARARTQRFSNPQVMRAMVSGSTGTPLPVQLPPPRVSTGSKVGGILK